MPTLPRHFLAALPLLLMMACRHTEAPVKPLGLGPLAVAERNTRHEVMKQASPSREAPAEEIRYEEPPPKPTAAASTTPPVAKSEPSASTSPVGNAAPTNAQPALDEWLGQYQGRDETKYVMAGQPDRAYDDPKAKIRVERASDKSVNFVFVDSSNGQDLCTLTGDVSGNEAKLAPGQKCFLDPDENMTVNSRPGVAKRDGKRLTLNVVIDTTYDFEDGRAEGRIEYEFEGQRP